MSELLEPRATPARHAEPGTWQQRLFVQFMRPEPTELVVLVEGEMDLSNADDLVGLIAGQAVGHRQLVVDLSAVDFLDTTAAIALVQLDGLLRPVGTAMRIVVAARRVLRPLALLGLVDRLAVEYRGTAGPDLEPPLGW